jgi:hypothetical protein
LATLILEENPKQEKEEFAELIHQSSNQQLQYIENFLKVLKEQDELLQDSDELKWIEFDTLIATVEK